MHPTRSFHSPMPHSPQDSPGQPKLNLEDLRNNIDNIDAKIVELLKQRAEYVHGVGTIKSETGDPIFVPERETSLMKKLERLNNGALPEHSLHAIYREIISCALNLEGGLKIAYLGPPGTWSHQASIKQFGRSVELIPLPNFNEIFDLVARGKADYGVVPIENSTDGSVSAAMDLFMHSPLKICAQVHLRIKNSLISSVSREEIKTLYSHPQVFGQTKNWILKNYPSADLVETSSTTKAAQLAKDNAAGALGCPLAAELFGLSVLEEDIQDNCNNTTRFAIIGKQGTMPTGKDRTSLLFHIHHQPGTLVRALDCFQKHGIDLVRIESRPSKVINWEYVFYIDTIGHADEEPLKTALSELEQYCSSVKVLGSYPQVDLI